ncbi:erythronate-4-phosphate dehydrogenase family protein [Senna tora]|uniref:Erythronate-4-phosphate dehydrogenase family protein n=1 Tax=Senna tora TaxID=362788 RepID=A0A835CG55_9FABA|nr:erythronate-4-phosphate dehydrogenase family protein [Senna tora]
MEDYYKANGNGAITDNGHTVAARHSYQKPCMKGSLPWLDIRVFYVRVCKCELDDSTPEVLTLNHIPLDPDTLLEFNGVRTSIYSDGVSTLLKRDRVDRKSEEVTFVSTDSIRTSGSVKYEVFDKDVLLLSGVLELCYDSSNGHVRESSGHNNGQRWIMNCESDLVPEHEASENQKYLPSALALQAEEEEYEYRNRVLYSRRGGAYAYEEGEGEDGELSWFNAGVRVGVGIGLSVCLGIGIGVGILVKSYQATTRNFRRRLF